MTAVPLFEWKKVLFEHPLNIVQIIEGGFDFCPFCVLAISTVLAGHKKSSVLLTKIVYIDKCFLLSLINRYQKLFKKGQNYMERRCLNIWYYDPTIFSIELFCKQSSQYFENKFTVVPDV